MPKGTKIARCVEKAMKKGMGKDIAIPVCQKSTRLSYKTGKKPKKK